MDTWCLDVTNLRGRDGRLIELWTDIKCENPAAPPGRPLRRLIAGTPMLRQVAGNGWRGVKRLVEGTRRAEVEFWVDSMVRHTTPSEWRMLTQLYDDTTPLPPNAHVDLSTNSPRLNELRNAYANFESPVSNSPIGIPAVLRSQLDLEHFRGETPYVQQYREWPRSTVLKYFIYAEYLHRRGGGELLEQLREDGAFGCWTFEYAGYPRMSRDVLDSVNEILFLDRALGIRSWAGLRVIDIGTGYGRLAHRMTQVAPDLDRYWCVDAIPEWTFISEYYLQYRRCIPPARVVPLHELDDALRSGGFDLALNIRSFSESSYNALEWWFDRLQRLQVSNLLMVPNDPDELLTSESDGSRRDFRPLVEAAGYSLTIREPLFDEGAVRELLGVPQQFWLFQRCS
jgi:hypothetical protein